MRAGGIWVREKGGNIKSKSVELIVLTGAAIAFRFLGRSAGAEPDFSAVAGNIYIYILTFQ
ncbi:hypothetical protein P606_17120 [Comamonas thiooxydans]|nr:hypothetical protein P606_17120 [Comamonas thiooxydans]